MPGIKTFEPNLSFCQIGNCSTLRVANSNVDMLTYMNVDSIKLEIQRYGVSGVNIVDVTNTFRDYKPGKVDTDGVTSEIVGTFGNHFTTDFNVGDYILIESTDEMYQITSIVDDTHLFVDGIPSITVGSDTSRMSFVYDITAADLGLSAGSSLPDTIYTIKYVITVLGVIEATETYTVATYCVAECCVHRMIASMAQKCLCEPCDTKCYSEVSLAYDLLQAIKNAALFGSIAEYNTLKAALNKICTINNCNCN